MAHATAVDQRPVSSGGEPPPPPRSLLFDQGISREETWFSAITHLLSRLRMEVAAIPCSFHAADDGANRLLLDFLICDGCRLAFEPRRAGRDQCEDQDRGNDGGKRRVACHIHSPFGPRKVDRQSGLMQA